jgi:hypothetical protein
MSGSVTSQDHVRLDHLDALQSLCPYGGCMDLMASRDEWTRNFAQQMGFTARTTM